MWIMVGTVSSVHNTTDNNMLISSAHRLTHPLQSAQPPLVWVEVKMELVNRLVALDVFEERLEGPKPI